MKKKILIGLSALFACAVILSNVSLVKNNGSLNLSLLDITNVSSAQAEGTCPTGMGYYAGGYNPGHYVKLQDCCQLFLDYEGYGPTAACN